MVVTGDRILTAPGQVLEMEEAQINGQTLRVWKNVSVLRADGDTASLEPQFFTSTGLRCYSSYSGIMLQRADAVSGWAACNIRTERSSYMIVLGTSNVSLVPH